MLSNEELELEREEARLRVQMDESIRQKAPRIYKDEGKKEAFIEMIHHSQHGLKREATPPERLQALSLEELRDLTYQLQQEEAVPPASALKSGLIETVHRFQRGLKREATPPERLQALSLEELQALVNQLDQDAFGPRAS